MTKDNFISLMTTVQRRLGDRNHFLDIAYEFCSDIFLNQLFDNFDMFRDYLYLIEDEICAAVGLEKRNPSADWLWYFVFDCECKFSNMKVYICEDPFPIESWSDVWDFYVELAR